MADIYYVGGKPYIKGRPASELDMSMAANAKSAESKAQEAAQVQAGVEAARVAEAQKAAKIAQAQKAKQAKGLGTVDPIVQAMAEAQRRKSIGGNLGGALSGGLGDLFN